MIGFLLKRAGLSLVTLWLLSVLRPHRRIRIGRRSTLSIVALAVLFTVVRNLPAGEFLSP